MDGLQNQNKFKEDIPCMTSVDNRKTTQNLFKVEKVNRQQNLSQQEINNSQFEPTTERTLNKILPDIFCQVENSFV